jgi:hypothetical protein
MKVKLIISEVAWDGFQRYWLSEGGVAKPLTPTQVNEILKHFNIKVLGEYFPSEVMARMSPEELQAENTLSFQNTVAGEDDDDSLTTYFWDRRRNTWMIDVNPENDDDHQPNPQPISEYCLDDLFFGLHLHHLSGKDGDKEFLEKILHLPPEQLRLL